MTLKLKDEKVPHIHMTITPETQISLCFVLRLEISEILAIFDFPIGHKVKFQSIFKF